VKDIKQFISILMTATSYCSLYSKGHAFVDELAQKALSILNGATLEKQNIEIMIMEKDIIANKNQVRDIGVHGTNLIKRFKKKGVSRVDFLNGLTFSELKQFIVDLSESNKGIKPSPHIKTGVVDVHIGHRKFDVIDFNQDGADAVSLTSEQIDKIKDVFHDISPYKMLNTAGIEDVVMNFIVSFKKEANILKLMSPVKSYSDYTYTHATNVAILSLFQAESLGIKDELLYNIGISALLHDVGKIFVSNEILEKQGKLDEKEWEEMQRHTLYGARYLAKIEGLPGIATIIALEHHLKYDGTGYPQFKVGSKKQHFFSQLVAISDFFDALRSRRPYKKDWDFKEILSLIKKDSGNGFNPFLVNHFATIMVHALQKN